MRLERRPSIFLLQLGAPGPAVFLKLPRFRDKAVCNADDIYLYDGIACRSCVVNALVKPRVESFKWFVGILVLPELPVVLREVCRQYLHVVHLEVAEEGQHGGSVVAGEHVLDGGQVSVLKCLEELIT